MRKGILFTIFGILMATSVLATDITLNVYKTDKIVKRFAVSTIDSVKMDKTNNLLLVYRKDKATISISMSEIDSMNYSAGEYALPSVETVSAKYESSLNKAICVANVSNDGGCEILERGICWSTGQNPTIVDNKYAFGTSTGQFYGTMTSLNAGTAYYVRTYASNCLGTTYGNTIKVETLMGNVTYTLGIDSAQYPTYFSLLKTALDEACSYYNKYTSFRANIWIYYNAGIPTAQANYHGSIGFGPNTSYMWVGTVMHEMAHFFGSGTTTIWKSKMVGGVWQGTVGQSLCQTLTGTTLKGDNGTNAVHYWPTGINYRSEVTSTNDLINHAKIVQAMLVNDCNLPTSW